MRVGVGLVVGNGHDYSYFVGCIGSVSLWVGSKKMDPGPTLDRIVIMASDVRND